jgi:hypothetical protein
MLQDIAGMIWRQQDLSPPPELDAQHRRRGRYLENGLHTLGAMLEMCINPEHCQVIDSLLTPLRGW